MATTVFAKMHYEIANRTEGRVLSVVVVQSEQSDFSNADTMTSTGGFMRGVIQEGRPNSRFKTYQKIIVQTDQRTFDTGTLMHGAKCAAYYLELTPAGVEVSRMYSFEIRRWLRVLLSTFLLTYLIKGLPLLLIAGRFFKRIYKGFLLLNGAFAGCFLFSLASSFGGPPGESVERSITFIYAALLLIAALEIYWYNQRLPQYPVRFTVGIIVGSLLLAFPGYLVMLFGLFIFGGC